MPRSDSRAARVPTPPSLPIGVWILIGQIAKLLMVVAIAIAVVSLLAKMAPKPIHQPVPASQLRSTIFPPSSDASVCGFFGHVTSAVETDDAAPYPLYDVTCSGNGRSRPITFTVAR